MKLKKPSRFAALLLLGLTLSTPLAQAAVHSVSTVGNSFSPGNLIIAAGDTVVWTNTGGEHDVVGGTAGAPNGTFDSNNQFGRLMAQGETFSHTFSATGSFPYYCTPHWETHGMTGTITVVGTIHQVELSSFQFTPRHLFITAGDAVRWVVVEGNHDTVAGTNGVPSGRWDSTAAFGRLMGPGDSFIVTFNSTGSFPYYCTPHWQSDGMTGSVTVARRIHTVTMTEFAFTPGNLTVETGDAVVWSNLGGHHDTVSGTNGIPGGAWDSNDQFGRLMEPGESFGRLFPAPGSFDYYCTPHWQSDGMTGNILVRVPSPAITQPDYNNGDFSFRFLTQPGIVYQIQCSFVLPPTWFTISGPIVGNGGTLIFTHPNAPAEGKFYRVVIP